MSEKKEYINFCETKTKYDLDKNSLLERQLLITNLDDLDTYSTIITTRIFDFLISLVPEENPSQNLSEKYYKINFIKFSKDDNYNVFSSEDDAMASNFEFSFTGIQKEFDSDEPRIYNTDIITKIEVSPDFISSYDKPMMDVFKATDNLSPISIYNYNYEESLQGVLGEPIYDTIDETNSTDKIEELFESIQKNQTNVNSKINSILEGNHAIINNIFSRFLGYPDMDFIAMYNNYQEIREREERKSAQKGGSAEVVVGAAAETAAPEKKAVEEKEKKVEEKKAEKELKAAEKEGAETQEEVAAAAAKKAVEEKEKKVEEKKAVEEKETKAEKEKKVEEKKEEATETEKKNKITIKLNGRGGKVRLNNTPKYIRLTFKTFEDCKELLSVKDSYKKKSIIYPFTYKYLESLFGKIYEKYKNLKKTGEFKNETLILNRDKIKLFFEVIPMTIIDNKTIDYNIDYFSRNILQDDKLLFKVKKDLSKFKDEELFLNLMKNPFIFIKRLEDSDFPGHKELYEAYSDGEIISEDSKLKEYLEKVGGETYINLFSELYGELLKKIKELIKNYTRKAEILAKKINDKQDGTDDETKKLVDTLYTTTGIKGNDQEILTNLIKKREKLQLDPFYKPDISDITINKDIRAELKKTDNEKKKAPEKYFEDGVIGELEVLKGKCNEINKEYEEAEAKEAAEAAEAKDKAHKQMLVLKHVIDLITGKNSQLINTLIKEKQFIEERQRELFKQLEAKQEDLESRKEGLKDGEKELNKLTAEAQAKIKEEKARQEAELKNMREAYADIKQELAKELEALRQQKALEIKEALDLEAQKAQEQAQTPKPISTLSEITNNDDKKKSLTTGLLQLNKVVEILNSDSSASSSSPGSSNTANTGNWYDSIREILENEDYNELAKFF